MARGRLRTHVSSMFSECRRLHLIPGVLLALFWLTAAGSRLPAEGAEYLSDRDTGLSITHRQQWGQFGLDTAAAAPGRPGTAMRIGERVFERGLGHHANGEIVVDLDGRHTAFCAKVGVQWQGGDQGSVIFQVSVDGHIEFECGPMSDSDPAKEVLVPLNNARELRLIAKDAGDGIGCDMANWAEARLVCDSRIPSFGPVTASLAGDRAPAASAEVCGLRIIARDSGPQVAVMEPAGTFTASVRRDEDVRFVIPVENVLKPMRAIAEVFVTGAAQAEVGLSLGGKPAVRKVHPGQSALLTTEPIEGGKQTAIVLTTRGVDGETGVRWRRLRYTLDDQPFDVPVRFPEGAEEYPPRTMATLRRSIEQELIEWDWRMQDGIGTTRETRTWAEAVSNVLQRGDDLIQNLSASAVSLKDLAQQWKRTRAQWQTLTATAAPSDSRWEDLWRRVHELRRRMVFQNPLARVGPIVFVKRVPSCFSHQLTQYYGMCARPGGGVFVLDAPGASMRCRQLGVLPSGSYLHPDVSWDGRRVLFAFCEADSVPPNRSSRQDRCYHLFEVEANGSNLRQLTEGPFDDFSPRYLPSGKVLFLSTRRGGFHRCGAGPCPVYTMAVANADGSDPRVISFHETHEWDPAVLNDGRIIYTRWDYVDRHAVHYQQLWTVRPDGTNPAAYYGNNTFNPVGVWEARPVPGSNLVMATAGAHHAMTAGSIILLDIRRGIDGLEPITRLTPDALFPESEFRVQHWHATAGVSQPPPVPPEQQRWPGHCYRTPYPLSEDYFLAGYSFDPLIGEPRANAANMFGIYLVDRFGNKELIYRDVNISSLWPTPLGPRERAAALPSVLTDTDGREGILLLQNVYDSWPKLSPEGKDTIKRLRIVQVLPKTTPNANSPRVGLANASPGKQVLGTVPVEPDGSAYFRAPAGIPLSFQALDERGMAVQTMRSLTYLQPGEQTTCIGCHEPRTTTPGFNASVLAGRRPPSTIAAGPDGSRPLSYPILVQPVLDRHCVECHRGPKAGGGIVLTGAPAGSFTASYNALAPLVPYSQWKGSPAANFEPLTRPNTFGARASKLTHLLLEGHEEVKLGEEDLQRLVIWMDTNALFYGTFDPGDQKRQQRGERIDGPALE